MWGVPGVSGGLIWGGEYGEGVRFKGIQGEGVLSKGCPFGPGGVAKKEVSGGG